DLGKHGHPGFLGDVFGVLIVEGAGADIATDAGGVEIVEAVEGVLVAFLGPADQVRLDLAEGTDGEHARALDVLDFAAAAGGVKMLEGSDGAFEQQDDGARLGFEELQAPVVREAPELLDDAVYHRFFGASCRGVDHEVEARLLGGPEGGSGGGRLSCRWKER